MAKPLWVHVQGPGGQDTTIQLAPAWLEAVRLELNVSDERIRAAAQRAAEGARMDCRPGVTAGFSQLVRERTRILLRERAPVLV